MSSLKGYLIEENSSKRTNNSTENANAQKFVAEFKPNMPKLTEAQKKSFSNTRNNGMFNDIFNDEEDKALSNFSFSSFENMEGDATEGELIVLRLLRSDSN